jgi:hypothetical protein
MCNSIYSRQTRRIFNARFSKYIRDEDISMVKYVKMEKNHEHYEKWYLEGQN